MKKPHLYLLLTWAVIALAACGSSREAPTTESMVGPWVATADSIARLPGLSGHAPRIVLHADGRFDAEDVPIDISGGRYRVVSARGQWSLWGLTTEPRLALDFELDGIEPNFASALMLGEHSAGLEFYIYIDDPDLFQRLDFRRQ